jgi:hypothetical protein
MKTFELYLAWAGMPLQACLAVLLYWRHVHKQFLFFFAYTIFSVISQIGSNLLLSHQHLYYQFYFASESLYIILGFLAIYEIFYWVFRNFYDMPAFRMAFPVMGILMLLVAALRFLLWSPADTNRAFATVLTLEISVSFLQFGVFALFFLLVRFFHTRWRRYAFGIALGFGIISAGNLTAFLLRSEFGKNFNPIVEITPPVAYLIGIVIWLAAFLRAEPEHPWKESSLALEPEEVIAELRRYTAAAKGVLKR